MKAEKIILETDQYGRLLQQPKLPPNTRMETIFLIPKEERQNMKRRKPSEIIMGKGKITGDIMTPVVPLKDWEALQ